MIGIETVRYETIAELRQGIERIAKKTGDRHEVNEIATAIFFRRSVWFRSPGLSVVVSIQDNALLIVLGWGDDIATWKDPMKAALIKHAKHNGIHKLQVRSPRKGWARVFGIKPKGELYEEEI